MTYGETVTRQIEEVEAVDDYSVDMPQLSFAKRALFRVLPFLDRTIEKKKAYKYDYSYGNFVPIVRHVKKSGRVIDKGTGAILVPSAELVSPIILPDFNSPEEEKAWKEEFMKQCEVPLPPRLIRSDTEET